MKKEYHLILKGDLAEIFLKYCNTHLKNKAQIVRRAIKNYLIKEGVLEKGIKNDRTNTKR